MSLLYELLQRKQLDEYAGVEPETLEEAVKPLKSDEEPVYGVSPDSEEYKLMQRVLKFAKKHDQDEYKHLLDLK